MRQADILNQPQRLVVVVRLSVGVAVPNAVGKERIGVLAGISAGADVGAAGGGGVESARRRSGEGTCRWCEAAAGGGRGAPRIRSARRGGIGIEGVRSAQRRGRRKCGWRSIAARRRVDRRPRTGIPGGCGSGKRPAAAEGRHGIAVRTSRCRRYRGRRCRANVARARKFNFGALGAGRARRDNRGEDERARKGAKIPHGMTLGRKGQRTMRVSSERSN